MGWSLSEMVVVHHLGWDTITTLTLESQCLCFVGVLFLQHCCLCLYSGLWWDDGSLLCFGTSSTVKWAVCVHYRAFTLFVRLSVLVILGDCWRFLASVVSSVSRACDLPFPESDIFYASLWPSLQLFCVALFTCCSISERMLHVPRITMSTTRSWAFYIRWVSLLCNLEVLILVTCPVTSITGWGLSLIWY